MNSEDLVFDEQRKLSSYINLCEQIKLMIDSIEFSSIDLNNNYSEKTESSEKEKSFSLKLQACLKGFN
jgi:hypothetical protein